MGDNETKTGAGNRAKHAFEHYHSKHDTYPDFGVGLEGGVDFKEQYELECFAWCVIFDGVKYGAAKSASFNLPSAVGKLVADGMELGHADDAVFGTTNSKQGQGAVGQLTRGLISRTAYYEPVVVLACIPFLWPELYPPPAPSPSSSSSSAPLPHESAS